MDNFKQVYKKVQRTPYLVVTLLASERSDDEVHSDAPMSPVQSEEDNSTRRTRRRRRSSDEAIGEAKRCCSVRSPAQDVNIEKHGVASVGPHSATGARSSGTRRTTQITRLDMSELRSIMEATESPAILAGDMNCKHAAWNAQQPNQGRELFNYVEARGYTVSGPETPTHYPDNPLHMPDVLDIAIHRGLHCQIAQEVIDDDLQSDHQPVLVVLAGMPTRLKPLAPRRLTDWTLFSEKLEATTPTRPIATAADVDLLADDVTACVKRALEEATTQSQPQGRGLQPPLPPRIHALVVEKRRLRKQLACRNTQTQEIPESVALRGQCGPMQRH
ncbi:hypothetical protein PYW07_013011 [Mythimna separata]|uniref:Endonuclease/exonuclease/phosphatase domain-containing protein n=1 Tax=Mythimna separata TaxID=271217 RepID=A0AAD8DJ07_MYTSE|nr:hypothetical protein PYW07_013011 [Mythimna separata]